MKEKKKFISNVNYNKSTEACYPCNQECEKINNRINKRKISQIKDKEVPHILKVFNFWFFLNSVQYKFKLYWTLYFSCL